jgi:hypothetical protein
VIYQVKQGAVCLSVMVFLIISACAPSQPVPVKPVDPVPSGTDGSPWWYDTVFYRDICALVL